MRQRRGETRKTEASDFAGGYKTFLLTEVSDSETPSALQRVNQQRECIVLQTTIKGSSLAVDWCWVEGVGLVLFCLALGRAGMKWEKCVTFRHRSQFSGFCEARRPTMELF